MNDRKERLVHLHGLLADNWRLLKRIYEMDSSLQSIYEMNHNDLQQYFSISPEKSITLHEYLQTNLQTYDFPLQVISIFDDDYPPLLKEIHDPPWVLYTLGNTQLLKTNMISVVGTRNPTTYGYDSLELIIKGVPAGLLTIVSGLALGIDAFAHDIAMKCGHSTIGVIGSGFHHLYPPQNKILAEKIIQSNLLITEYPPWYTPRKWYFPKRNRIISGLSLGTIIVEAKEKSGSLITADSAMEQGREVFAVPGAITSISSKGTNQLIQQGAKLVMTAEDILEEIREKIRGF